MFNEYGKYNHLYSCSSLPIYPSSAFKTEYLAAVLNIYAVKAEDLFCLKKATGLPQNWVTGYMSAI